MRRPVAPALLAAASISLAAACASNQPSGPPAGAGTGVVVHLVDGDTLDVELAGRRERVRLIGVDTPESVHPNKPVQCYGVEASAFLSALVPEGTEVRLERDAVARDRFDRLLAYVYRADDDLLVNLELVRQGYADAVTYGDNEALYPTFAAAEAEARAGGRGLWGVCGGPDVDLPSGEGG
jgi:micrococcal nuclease